MLLAITGYAGGHNIRHSILATLRDRGDMFHFQRTRLLVTIGTTMFKSHKDFFPLLRSKVIAYRSLASAPSLLKSLDLDRIVPLVGSICCAYLVAIVGIVALISRMNDIFIVCAPYFLVGTIFGLPFLKMILTRTCLRCQPFFMIGIEFCKPFCSQFFLRELCTMLTLICGLPCQFLFWRIFHTLGQTSTFQRAVMWLTISGQIRLDWKRLAAWNVGTDDRHFWHDSTLPVGSIMKRCAALQWSAGVRAVALAAPITIPHLVSFVQVA